MNPNVEQNLVPIFEMAREVWQSKVARADDIDDISEVFREVFKENIPSSGSPYFKDTYTSQVVSLDKLVAREPADPERVKRAHQKMAEAKEGTGEKRKPISVIDMGNGKFKVLDGNTTLQALRELGETEAVVEVKKSLKQQVTDPKSLDDVYAQAEKALPDFKAWIERYATDTHAVKIMMRPGLKGKERAAQKVANDYAGVAARLTDVIGATLLYDSVEHVAAALHVIGKDPAVFKVKNRYENPTPEGYRDVLMVVQVGGHLCELQLNTQAMLDVKEKGLGHKIYEVIRQIKPLADDPDAPDDLDILAKGYIMTLRDISVRVYRDAALMSSSSSSANNMASDSEIGLEFNRILAKLSGSLISTQVSGLRESIRKMLPVDFSMAKGESSFSTKSNKRFIDVPPFDAKNITRNGRKVKAKVETGKKDQVYLNNETPLVVQWAVVEADDLVSSHDTDFRLNPEFPQELQPRDRTRKQMQKQIYAISGKLNPELLGRSLYASAGAPIVGRDLIVESGNGRVLSLKMRYSQDGAPQYRQWIEEHARDFGIQAEALDAMLHPVMVRIRLSENDRKMVAERANERDVAAMSPAETAKMDSGRLRMEDMALFNPGVDGDIGASSNNDFIRNFLKIIGPEEAAGVVTSDGKPTRQLLDRIQAAIFEKAYHDDRLLALIAEDANPDIRNILKALTAAASVFAKVKGLSGEEQIDVIEHIIGAVDVIRRAKREGENVETLLRQLSLFGDDIPEETAAITRYLVENARSSKRISDFLQAIARKYLYWAENKDQVDLFGNLPEKPVAKATINEILEYGDVMESALFESAGSGDFVMAPNGTINFGQITPEIAKVVRRQAGYIRMREGSTVTTGASHINRPERMAQIMKVGFKNAIDLVYFIASGFTKIYKGKGKRLILVNEARQPVTAYIELEPDSSGDFYDVKTAFPTNKSFLKNKELLWSDSRDHQQHYLAPSDDLGHSNSGKKVIQSNSDVNTILEDAMILERIAQPYSSYIQAIKEAKGFADIEAVFKEIFTVTLDTVTINSYRDPNSEYGLVARGIKTREKINNQCREILGRVNTPNDLSDEDKAVLKQYSGKGGLTENSQYEYYTPTFVAQGLWDALLANGFQNGNVCDPCTGAGVFSGTKPREDIRITGCDIDPVGSKIAALLNPDDHIENKPFEAVVMETPDDTFDSFIGNVPFGDVRGKSAHLDPDYKNEKRIERYFLLRALDKVKPGGLCVFVVPTNIVGAKGAKWEQFRIACSKKAEFLGAHKLPSKTFSAQGTDTVVDVVVFRKHSKEFLDRVNDIPFDTLKQSNVVWEEFVQGRYWMGEGRPYIMGKYIPKVEGERWSREIVDGDIDSAAIRQKLAAKFHSRINWDMLEVAEPITRNYVDGDRRVMNGLEYELTAGHWVRVQPTITKSAIDPERYGASSAEELESILANNKSVLQLSAKQMWAAYKLMPEKCSALQVQAIEFAMSQQDESLREQVFRGSIIGGMISRYHQSVINGTADDNERLMLQEIVSDEIRRYGHPKNNTKLKIAGESSRMFGMFMNAVDEQGIFSDLLAGTLETSKEALFDSGNVQSIVEYLYNNEGFEYIGLEDVKKLYAGPKDLTMADIAEIPGVAITADMMIMPMGRFCSGEIYSKMQELMDAIGTEEVEESIKAKWRQQIQEIDRKRIKTNPEDITFGLRQKWFSPEYVVEFLRQNGYPNVDYGRWVEVPKEDPVTGKMITRKEFQQDYDTPFGEFVGIEGSGFNNQFLKYLNGGNVTSTDQERIAEYKNHARVIEENFNVWMKQRADIDDIAEIYNRKFNGFLRYEHDGTDLGLKNVSPQVKLHDYQNAGIRRFSEEGRGILGYDVGLGKTFTALGLIAYNNQMGRSKKTCIVVPDSVLENWYHSAKSFYGTMEDVLMVGYEPVIGKDGKIEQEMVLDENGNPKRNKYTGEIEYQDKLVKRNSKQDIFEKMWEIPQTNKKIVVMSKEKFAMIPMMAETKTAYTGKMLEKALISERIAKTAVEENSKGAKISYQDAKNIDRLEAVYSDEGTRKAGELPYFEMMGFTDVVVDEAHCFPYDTDIVTSEGLMKIGYIVENNIETNVLSFNVATNEISYKPITGRASKRLFKNLVEVVHEHGKFVCTTDHLIWTEKGGYVEAGKLGPEHLLHVLRQGDSRSETGRPIVLQQMVCEAVEKERRSGKTNMQAVREGILCRFDQGIQQEESILQHKMFGALENESTGNESKIQRMDQFEARLDKGEKTSCCIGKNEDTESYGQAGMCGKNEAGLEGKRVQEPGRKWTNDRSTKNVDGSNQCETGICDINKTGAGPIQKNTEFIQSGSGSSRNKNSHRGGRQESFVEENQGEGFEENPGVILSRVVSVTILERRDFEQHGYGDPENTIVYDIEVGENHNFYANGVLAHNCFKNSYQGGEKTQNIAYLPNAPSAKRSLDMAMKLNFIRDSNSGRGAYLLTATPVTNSPTEIFNMLSLVCDVSEFERFGVYTVDDFVRVFGDIQSINKVRVDGSIVSKDGLVGFQNLGGLRSVFHKFVLLKNAQDVNLPLPPHEDIHDAVELTSEQQEVYETLRKMAKEAASPGSQKRGEESMFGVIRNMDRVTTDMDLYRHTMTFVFRKADQQAVDALIRDLPKSLAVQTVDEESNERISYQKPLTTDTRVEGDSYILVVPEEFESHVVNRLKKFGIQEKDVTHPLMPKYARLIENMKKEIEIGGKQLVFTEEKTQHEKIMRIMVHNIPMISEQIGIINAETASGGALQGISDSYNSGKLSVIIANKKAEVGVNLQKGTTAIHHLTLPWTPASIQQRNGRGVRQGNTAKQIRIYYYLGKGSFDEYRLDLLNRKANWIRDLFLGKDERAENANAFNQDDYLDMLEANPEEAKRRRLERLEEKRRQDEEKERKRLANQLQVLISIHKTLVGLEKEKSDTIEKVQKRIDEASAKISTIQKQMTAVEQGSEVFNKLVKNLADTQQALKKSQERLAGIDAEFQKKQTDLEARKKQISGYMKGLANQGKLPFKPEIVDNPGAAMVTLSGEVISVGDMFEYNERHGNVVKITQVDSERKTVEYKSLLADDDDPPSIGKAEIFMKAYKRVSYSQAEIDRFKMLNRAYNYSDLAKLDKSVVMEFLPQITFRPYSSEALFVKMPNGEDAFIPPSKLSLDVNRGAVVIYPEPSDPDFVKRIAVTALKELRANQNRYDINHTLSGLFGDDYENLLMQYAKSASQTEMMEAISKAYQEWYDKLEDKSPEEVFSKFYFNGRRSIQDQALGQLADFDNQSDIRREIMQFLNAKDQELKEAARQESERRAEEEREAKRQALKSMPGYKEIPPEIVEAFKKIGIQVDVNPGALTYRVSRFKTETAKPFSRWLFHDSAGINGRLYKTKEILKARYGAKFFKDESIYRGGWWHLPSKYSLDEIYELLA